LNIKLRFKYNPPQIFAVAMSFASIFIPTIPIVVSLTNNQAKNIISFCSWLVSFTTKPLIKDRHVVLHFDVKVFPYYWVLKKDPEECSQFGNQIMQF